MTQQKLLPRAKSSSIRAATKRNCIFFFIRIHRSTRVKKIKEARNEWKKKMREKKVEKKIEIIVNDPMRARLRYGSNAQNN